MIGRSTGAPCSVFSYNSFSDPVAAAIIGLPTSLRPHFNRIGHPDRPELRCGRGKL